MASDYSRNRRRRFLVHAQPIPGCVLKLGLMVGTWRTAFCGTAVVDVAHRYGTSNDVSISCTLTLVSSLRLLNIRKILTPWIRS